ncbi:MAG: TRAP transporter substrate-binding protein DctP [Kiritimatiellia bacterium]
MRITLLLLLTITLVACSSDVTHEPYTPAGTGNYTGPAINARLASEEIEGDFMTVWARTFADHMREWSGGRINIEVFPYGTLGTAGDINELAQMGVIEFVFSDYAWISSFVPQAQVLSLNYLFPPEGVPEVLDWIARHGQFPARIEEAFRRNDLVPLGVLYEGWQWVSANHPIRALDDMDGLRLRLMSSRLLVETYRAYGASPTPMAYGEVYSSLQMGMIDAQVNPLFAAYSMKFFEVQDHFTQLRSEPFLGIPTVNQPFFDGLQPEVQAEMRRFWRDTIIPAGQWIDERNESDRAKMLAERPQLQFSEISDEVMDTFRERAETVYSTFVGMGGEGAEEILAALQQDIANAITALAIE